MKKVLSLLLCLLLLGATCVAAADYQSGDTVTITVSVSNPNKACAFDVGFSYDKTAFQFVSATGNSGVAGGSNGFSFAAWDPFAGGTIGTATFKVTEHAVPGKSYTISCYSMGAYNFDDSEVDISVSVSGGSVTIKCSHVRDNGEITTEPTCTETGLRVYSCTVCGEKLDEEEVAALGHTMDEGVVTLEPTCTETGLRSYTCTACGEEIKDEEIPALGHSSDEGVVTLEPTCTETGLRTYTCTTCGEKLEEEEIAALGHSVDEGVVTLEPTCTETGLRSYTCIACGEKIEDEEVPALGHAADEGVVTLEPTCTETGLCAHTCTVCGAAMEDSVVEALGHDQGEWIITIPVTENTDGERELHCTRCDALLKTEVIPYAVYYQMNACSVGPHFRDVNDVTDKWYMFTPVDLSVEGVQTYDLIAGDKHVIGKVYVLVENGEVIVTYELVNKEINVKSEFLTFFGSINDVTTVDTLELTGYAFGEPISIADALGGDTKVLLYVHNGVVYDEMGWGIREFYHRNAEYLQYVEECKLLMD